MDSLARKLQIFHLTKAIVKSTKLPASIILLNSCRTIEDGKVWGYEKVKSIMTLSLQQLDNNNMKKTCR